MRMGACLPIRANSVLPARREAVTLHTADGLELVGELAVPQDRDPVATLVCLHPLPTHGGMMDSHVFRKAAFRLPALAGVAVLRFNTRGTSSVQGTSEGELRQRRRRAVRRRRGHRVRRVPRPAGHLAAGLVVRHRPGADARPATRPCTARSCSRRRCASRPRAPRGVGRVGQAADRARARARRLPAARRRRGSGSPPCPRPRWSASTAPSTCGSVTPRRSWTWSCSGSRPEVDVPLPTEWDGPMETADTSALRRPDDRGRSRTCRASDWLVLLCGMKTS